MTHRHDPGAGPGLALLAALGLVLMTPAVGLSKTPARAAPSMDPLARSAAEALQDAYASIIDAVGPSVVVIETPSGLGSGVVFDDKGHIVTNAHVVGDATSFTVTTAAGKRLDGKLVGRFVPDDLAVIKVMPDGLVPADFGGSSDLRVGSIVLAIGNPLGLQSSVTDGIVSALGRTVSEPSGAALPGVIQTSAAVNPGNSGGALVDLDGHVVGIPTLAATDPELGGSAPGIGFAIPSDLVVDIAHQLIQDGKVTRTHRAYLGMRIADVASGDGVYVYSLDRGGPADAAGLPKDVLIVSVDGQVTPDSATLAEVLAGLDPGQTVKVRFERADGTRHTVDVTLGELPG
jgi:putative serine protease PepD